MGFAQREACSKKQTNKKTLLIIIYVDHHLTITVAEVTQHRTVCDATGGCLNHCHGGAEWLCRENKTLERAECVCTGSLIQRMRFISLSATDRVGLSLLLMCSVDYQPILWMLSDQFIQITP